MSVTIGFFFFCSPLLQVISLRNPYHTPLYVPFNRPQSPPKSSETLWNFFLPPSSKPKSVRYAFSLFAALSFTLPFFLAPPTPPPQLLFPFPFTDSALCSMSHFVLVFLLLEVLLPVMFFVFFLFLRDYNNTPSFFFFTRNPQKFLPQRSCVFFFHFGPSLVFEDFLFFSSMGLLFSPLDSFPGTSSFLRSLPCPLTGPFFPPDFPSGDLKVVPPR